MGVYMAIGFVVLLVHVLRGKTKHREIFIPEWRAFVVGIPFLSTFILLIACFYTFLIRPLLKIRKVRNMGIFILETLRWFLCCPRKGSRRLSNLVPFTFFT